MGFLCLALAGFSQLAFGVRSNYSISTSTSEIKELVQLEPMEVLDLEYKGNANKFSYGLMLHDQNERVFFSGELLYSKSSQEFTMSNRLGNFQRDESIRDFTYSQTELSLPVAAGLVIGNFKLGGGPILNYRLGEENALDFVDGIESRSKKINMGFQLVAGMIINNHIHLDIKREINFHRVGDNYTYNGEPFKMQTTPNTLSIGLGILL